jgi:hypothetical protein
MHTAACRKYHTSGPLNTQTPTVCRYESHTKWVLQGRARTFCLLQAVYRELQPLDFEKKPSPVQVVQNGTCLDKLGCVVRNDAASAGNTRVISRKHTPTTVTSGVTLHTAGTCEGHPDVIPHSQPTTHALKGSIALHTAAIHECDSGIAIGSNSPT